MKTVDEATRLAEAMVRLGRELGRRVGALVSDMNQPLGWAVGNALEVQEAINVLHEDGPPDLREHCLVVAAEMLALAGRVADSTEGVELAAQAIADGSAWRKFRALIAAQGGDVRFVDEPDRLPRAPIVEPIPAPTDGYLQKVDAAQVGMAVVDLGGGREKKEDPIDHSVGVIVHYKVGDRVQKGTPLCTIHASDRVRLERAKVRLLQAHTIGPEPVPPLPLFYKKIAQ